MAGRWIQVHLGGGMPQLPGENIFSGLLTWNCTGVANAHILDRPDIEIV